MSIKQLTLASKNMLEMKMVMDFMKFMLTAWRGFGLYYGGFTPQRNISGATSYLA